MLKNKLAYLFDNIGNLEGFEGFALCATFAIAFLSLIVGFILVVFRWPFLLMLIPVVLIFTTIRAIHRIWKQADKHIS